MLEIETFPVGSLSCNCSILYSPFTKECLVIDPGNDAKLVLNRIRKKGLKVKGLLHTHAHFDHIGQSQKIKDELSAPILLHKGDLFLYEMLEQQGLWFGETIEKPGPVDQWIEDEQLLAMKVASSETEDPRLQEVVKILHTPGHTPGSCSFYCEHLANPVIFSGDTLFAGSIGRTDLPGGDSEQIVKSIKNRLLPLPEESLCIPGHGPSTVLHQEKRQNPFLK